MRKTHATLALLTTLAAFTSTAHAASTPHAATSVLQNGGVLTTTTTADSVTYTFSGLTLAGFEFATVGGGADSPFYGTLTSVSVNATLDASVAYTYGDDLTIYVAHPPLGPDGLLQVGGFSDTGALERHSWGNGGSSAPGTTVIDTIALDTPLTFAGGAGDPTIWLGNGYGASDAEGTWSGSITLTGISTTAPVPEPSSMALMALGGLGLVGWARRRRSSANS